MYLYKNYSMENIQKELIRKIEKIHPQGDLSDIGNAIGIIIGKYISDKDGFDEEDFLGGITHGISITKGKF